MIPAIRFYWEMEFHDKKYGSYIDLPEGSGEQDVVEAARELACVAECTYDYLKNRQEEK